MLLLDQHTGTSQNHTARKTKPVALRTLWRMRSCLNSLPGTFKYLDGRGSSESTTPLWLSLV